VPTFSAANVESGGGGFDSCGPYEYVPLIVNQEDQILAMSIAGRAKLDSSALSGDVQGVFFPSRSAHVGDRTCEQTTWSFEADGEATDTKLAAFDLAGNFSGWSGPQTIDAGCGCEVAGGARPAAGGYVLAGIGLAAIAMRRRRRAAFRLVSSADPR
jgi:MYXO-CTERM domain-containing protein